MVRALLQAAGVDLAGLKVRTNDVRFVPDGIEYTTTIDGFTRPMDGDDTVTEQVDQLRATIVQAMSESFAQVDSDDAWVSVTTKAPRRLSTPEEQIAWARARKLSTFSFRLPPVYLSCPIVAHNSLDDFLADSSRLERPYQEVEFHGTYRWCPDCMDGCHCLDFVEVLGIDPHGHDEDMRCIWCQLTGRAPYEARIAGAMIGEGLDL
ncbi:hypothetical protein [Nocardia sp. NRRL S-836]|uniref:hypothetical protein n=1 Tax=Nocardia sp. NRRL S-836 TaxID=1519492 RepID=UPI0006AEFC3A|nr:hypothetical protein [Nocardia sp. NRRL S-836]